jgi:2-succinyl-5-enolpyruvyl-6-hydroxy-3-cyclohexene-1-carboxylate synthase
MYSSKKSVVQTIALLKAFGINDVVLSPGSRNAPLIQGFAIDPFFRCHSVVDERSASFYAIGIIYKTKKPVVICCTSGTALLNYHPAVAEAYYQNLPLIVISADRSPAWIGQMDGQTVPQVGVFGNLVKKSVQLPEIKNEEEYWYCNRLLNETLITCQTNNPGPVHINVPISEPLFDFSLEKLPEPRKINQIEALNDISDKDIRDLAEIWKKSGKRVIMIGQMSIETTIDHLMVSNKNDFVLLNEHLSNSAADNNIYNFDAILSGYDSDNIKKFSPDLLITFGGHIVSKRIKNLLRNNPPQCHWHISLSNEIPDTYKSITHFINTDPEIFFRKLENHIADSHETDYEYISMWHNKSLEINSPDFSLPFSDIAVTGFLMNSLPANAVLFVANSSSVRNIQLYNKDKTINVYCNRGTNGIEGTLSAAIGYATIHEGEVFLLVGDLSFFYDLNSLWNFKMPENLHIMLINNGGGGIFHLLPGLENAESLDSYVSASHSKGAGKWIEATDLDYLKAENYDELNNVANEFLREKRINSVILEIITDKSNNKKAVDQYYNNIKNK